MYLFDYYTMTITQHMKPLIVHSNFTPIIATFKFRRSLFGMHRTFYDYIVSVTMRRTPFLA